MKLYCLVLLMLASGCSAFKSKTQPLAVSCSQPGAYVTVNGDRVEPPVTVELRRNAKVKIEAQKEGFTPYAKTISYHLNSTGTLDAVGTVFLFFPGFGVLFPGAWDLNETNVNIDLYKITPN